MADCDTLDARVDALEKTVNGNGNIGLAETVRNHGRFIDELDKVDIMTAVHDLKNAESARQSARREQRKFNYAIVLGLVLLLIENVFKIM